MTSEEVVNSKKRKGRTKMASQTRNEIYEDYEPVDVSICTFMSTAGADITNENRDENPLDTLPEDLIADAILNVGKILSQRNTERDSGTRRRGIQFLRRLWI
ncbi:hypothetical protein V1522DRAFT_389393 [Lipomyces starkeyi]